MKYVSPIDMHTHCRSTEYRDSGYLKLAHDHAAAVGLCALAEMPNTTPTLTRHKEIHERINEVHALGSRVKHYIHAGMTTDMNQVSVMLNAIQERAYWQLVADKIFYTHSTGQTGLLDPDIQKEIWKMKGEMGYTGVSIGHFEDEKFFVKPFDPKDPVTHSYRQAPEAETAQIERQLRWAYDFNFQGTFYVAHCSSHGGLELLARAKRDMPFRIIVEGTFHHLFLNHDDYEIHGNRVKCNPPIRSRNLQELLIHHLQNGVYDIIGTDHAPHPLTRKDDPINPASGLPCIPFWPKGIEILRKVVGERKTEDMTYRVANSVFRLGLPRVEVEREYNPELFQMYGYNPFSRIDGTGGSNA